MKIGIFNDNFPPILDGVALTAKNYADWLQRKEQEVCVVTAKAPHEAYDLPYPVYGYWSLPIPKRKPYRWGVPHLDARVMYHLNRTELDLIHAHCPFATGVLAENMGRLRKIPVVATFHSKYRQDFERVIKSDKVVDGVIKQIVSFYNNADEVWVPQASVAPVLREYGFSGHVEVVDNGNDFACSSQEVQTRRDTMRKQLGLSKEETMLLFVGQHIWEKNIAFILDSLARMADLPWRLYMIGTGYAAKDIAEKVRTLGLERKVTMVGNVQDRSVLQSFYAAADLFLFPSLYDNAPLVVREAAAMHTPSVMLSDSTSAEIIQSGYNGFLTIHDIHAYSRTIRHLMEHPEKIVQVGKNASTTIARSWEDVVDEVILRYQDICRRYKDINHYM